VASGSPLRAENSTITKLKRPLTSALVSVEYTLAPTTPLAGRLAPIAAIALVAPWWVAAARTRGAMLPAPLPYCSKAAVIAAIASRMVRCWATSASLISRTLGILPVESLAVSNAAASLVPQAAAAR
jgi:hypothetical protein